MLMYFTDIADAMLKVHDVDPTFRNAMNSRMKHFQDQDFPRPRRTKEKIRLGMDDVLKVVFAFELLAAGIAPIRAARVTATDWPIIREAIAAGWWRLQMPEAKRPERRLVGLVPNAFSEFGSKELLAGVPLSETVGALTVDEIGRLPNSRLVLVDAGTMAVAFGSALRNVEDGDFDRAMRLFCADAFGSDDVAHWTIASASATRGKAGAPA